MRVEAHVNVQRSICLFPLFFLLRDLIALQRVVCGASEIQW